eukprot:297502_1
MSSSGKCDIRVITCGFSRCGTVSMKYALERLGFGKCIHMIDGAKGDAEYSSAMYWFYDIEKRIQKNEIIEWDELFNQIPECQSCSDWPTSLYWEELMQYYPNSKIILTVRDDPQRWHKSLVVAFKSFTDSKIAMIFPKFHKGYDMLFNQWFPKYFNRFEGGANGFFINKNNTAINYYHNHIKYVKSKVPKHRLLIFNFKNGYEPLCRFLNVDIPIDPKTGKYEQYPHKNDRHEVQRVIKQSIKNEVLKFTIITGFVYIIGRCVKKQFLMQ